MEYFHKNRLLKKIVYKFARARAELIFCSLKEFLKNEETLLDIGCGSCNIIEVLNENNLNVVALDIKNLSIIHGIKPIVYDGKRMPFVDNTFDCSMILTVLHHTTQQKELLDEAMRVTKRKIIVLEDIYTNKIDRYVTQFVDSIINLELRHPRTNRTDSEWRLFFKSLGLRIVNVRFPKRYLVFKPVLYELEII